MGWILNKILIVHSSIRKMLKERNLDDFQLIFVTYESKLENEKVSEKVDNFRSYISKHRDYISDWLNE
ncbi:MAG TPA: hypothetical protein VK105_13740 [Virgibacillus sp.]|nr:hypothetical protein [Virgibacillus sp.]HLR68169.1 hypothetical protein [Virgibacillus sp.]